MSEQPFNNKDKFLSRIIAEADLQKPGSNFTDKLMSQIEFSQQKLSVAESDISFIFQPTWIALGVAVVSLIVCLIFVDFSFITQFFTEVGFGKINIVSLFSSVKVSFMNFFQELRIYSTATIAVFVLAAIFLIDRFILRIRAIHVF